MSKVCRKEYMKAYRRANKEKIAEYRRNNKDYQKVYYLANKEANKEAKVVCKEVIAKRNKAYSSANKEKLAKYNRAYNRDNKDARNAHCSKRRCAKLERTVAWSDLDAIKAVYTEAQRLTKETGEQHHVDHIIPLQGKLVSGLHVENNLQVLSAYDNLSKSNTFN